MTNSPTFKLIDLPSLRRSSPWDLRRRAAEVHKETGHHQRTGSSLDVILHLQMEENELRQLADFREEQLFESGAKLKERLETPAQKESV